MVKNRFAKYFHLYRRKKKELGWEWGRVYGTTCTGRHLQGEYTVGLTNNNTVCSKHVLLLQASKSPSKKRKNITGRAIPVQVLN